MKAELKYLDGTYESNNPDWHRGDAQWKAKTISNILIRNNFNPKSIIEVGCGTGDILKHLRNYFKNAKLIGYDVSPLLKTFWEENLVHQIEFRLGDYDIDNMDYFDLLLMIDVFEHVRDPFTFLENAKKHSKYFVFHIPLDLSAQGIVRNAPLINARRKLGHIHSYTKDLALETIKDCGYNVIDFAYTGASFNMPNRSLMTRIAHFPRWLLRKFDEDLAVRILGGETLIVLAE